MKVKKNKKDLLLTKIVSVWTFEKVMDDPDVKHAEKVAIRTVWPELSELLDKLGLEAEKNKKQVKK